MPSYGTGRHVAGLQVAVVLRHVVMSSSWGRNIQFDP